MLNTSKTLQRLLDATKALFNEIDLLLAVEKVSGEQSPRQTASSALITYYWLEINTRRRGSDGRCPSPVDRQVMFELRQFEHGARLSQRIWDECEPHVILYKDHA